MTQINPKSVDPLTKALAEFQNAKMQRDHALQTQQLAARQKLDQSNLALRGAANHVKSSLMQTVANVQQDREKQMMKAPQDDAAQAQNRPDDGHMQLVNTLLSGGSAADLLKGGAGKNPLQRIPGGQQVQQGQGGRGAPAQGPVPQGGAANPDNQRVSDNTVTSTQPSGIGWGIPGLVMGAFGKNLNTTNTSNVRNVTTLSKGEVDLLRAQTEAAQAETAEHRASTFNKALATVPTEQLPAYLKSRETYEALDKKYEGAIPPEALNEITSNFVTYHDRDAVLREQEAVRRERETAAAELQARSMSDLRNAQVGQMQAQNDLAYKQFDSDTLFRQSEIGFRSAQLGLLSDAQRFDQSERGVRTNLFQRAAGQEYRAKEDRIEALRRQDDRLGKSHDLDMKLGNQQYELNESGDRRADAQSTEAIRASRLQGANATRREVREDNRLIFDKDQAAQAWTFKEKAYVDEKWLARAANVLATRQVRVQEGQLEHANKILAEETAHRKWFRDSEDAKQEFSELTINKQWDSLSASQRKAFALQGAQNEDASRRTFAMLLNQDHNQALDIARLDLQKMDMLYGYDVKARELIIKMEQSRSYRMQVLPGVWAAERANGRDPLKSIRTGQWWGMREDQFGQGAIDRLDQDLAKMDETEFGKQTPAQRLSLGMRMLQHHEQVLVRGEEGGTFFGNDEPSTVDPQEFIKVAEIATGAVPTDPLAREQAVDKMLKWGHGKESLFYDEDNPDAEPLRLVVPDLDNEMGTLTNFLFGAIQDMRGNPYYNAAFSDFRMGTIHGKGRPRANFPSGWGPPESSMNSPREFQEMLRNNPGVLAEIEAIARDAGIGQTPQE